MIFCNAIKVVFLYYTVVSWIYVIPNLAKKPHILPMCAKLFKDFKRILQHILRYYTPINLHHHRHNWYELGRLFYKLHISYLNA